MTSHGRALTSGPLHPVVSGPPRGTSGSNIRAKPPATSTPCRPDASVSPSRCRRRRCPWGGTNPRDACRLFGHATTPLRMYDGPVRRSGGIATPGPPSRLTLERLTTGSSPLTLHGRALSSGPPHPVVLGQPIGTLWSNIRARPTARSPPRRPVASVSPLQVPAVAPSVRGAKPRRRVPPLGTCHHTTPHV